MISSSFAKKLKSEYDKNNGERRQIISLSNIILHDSKRVIFALHRGNIKKAEAALKEIESLLLKLDKKFGHQRINEEGSYRAGVEEFVEAKTFLLVVQGKKITSFKGLNINYDGYLGGLCDLTGELVRRAVNNAADGNTKEVMRMKEIISNIMEELVEFDMTGYLRTKYDQAKGSLRKIEQITYDLKIRQ